MTPLRIVSVSPDAVQFRTNGRLVWATDDTLKNCKLIERNWGWVGDNAVTTQEINTLRTKIKEAKELL